MKPIKLKNLANKYGKLEVYKAGEVFHSQDFPSKLFVIYSGYVKRYRATMADNRVIELIYGPDHIVSLSQLYKKIFGISQNQENLVYVYQAMTNVKLLSIDEKKVLEELEKDPELYKDFFYESGLKLRSNIARLASNSLDNGSKKVAHQLVSLAYEFAGLTEGSSSKSAILPLPETPSDLSEQLNIPTDVAAEALNWLEQNNLINVKGSKISILDIDLLKDVYLS